MKVVNAIKKRIRHQIKRVWYAGNRYYCPCCDMGYRTFLPFGIEVRAHALCPGCRSLERHRAYWLYMQRKTNLLTTPQRMLHFSPNPALQASLSQLDHLCYLAVDFTRGNIRAQMDITRLALPENSFDVVICSHVLEHILDDQSAMSELYRVLKPGGWALLQVPISDNPTTYEDPTITLPEERERAFGQIDHVRLYGQDYPRRLKLAGFTVRSDTFIADLPLAEQEKYRLVPETFFIGTK